MKLLEEFYNIILEISAVGVSDAMSNTPVS